MQPRQPLQDLRQLLQLSDRKCSSVTFLLLLLFKEPRLYDSAAFNVLIKRVAGSLVVGKIFVELEMEGKTHSTLAERKK